MPDAWFVTGEQFIRNVQAHGTPVLDVLFGWASFLGEEYFYLLLLPFLYWCVDKTLGRWVAYALLTSAYVNSALKYVWRTPRPPATLWRNVVVRPTSPGFPSGHAQTSTVVWGTLAYRVRKVWMWGLALLLIALISFSRIYNGVHYPHDVLGGLAVGLVVLVVLNGVGMQVATWAVNQPLLNTVLVLTGGVLILGALHPPSKMWPAPEAVTVLATIWGASVGFLLEERHVHFNPSGTWLQRAGRFVVGMAVTGVIYIGLHFIRPQGGEAIVLIWQAIRYALVGLLIAWGAPWLFVRVGFASEKERASNGTSA